MRLHNISFIPCDLTLVGEFEFRSFFDFQLVGATTEAIQTGELKVRTSIYLTKAL